MAEKLKSNVYSEIGELEGVIIHTPGREVENMTPRNAEKALYSDILNKNIVDKEYSQFKQVLSSLTQTYEVKDLLAGALVNEKIKYDLVRKITVNERVEYLHNHLMGLSPDELARQLIEGVVMNVDNLTKYLSTQRYSLVPLHNFFFTRDASISIYDKVLIISFQSLF